MKDRFKKGVVRPIFDLQANQKTRCSVNQDALNLTDIEACESIVSFNTSQAFETHVEEKNCNTHVRLGFEPWFF